MHLHKNNNYRSEGINNSCNYILNLLIKSTFYTITVDTKPIELVDCVSGVGTQLKFNSNYYVSKISPHDAARFHQNTRKQFFYNQYFSSVALN